MAKYDTTGNLIWVSGYGKPSYYPNGGDFAAGIAVGRDGSIYIVGMEDNLNAPNYTTQSFVSKYTSAGNLAWIIYGTTGTRNATPNLGAISVDSSNYIYLTGSYNGTTTFNGVTISGSGLYAAKCNAAGTVQWVTGFSASSGAYGIGVSATSLGDNLYFTGYYGKSVTFGGITLTNTLQGFFLMDLSYDPPPPLAPTITKEPANYASCPGSSSILEVTVTGTPPFSLNWQKNGTNMVDSGNVTGSATTNLTLINVSQGDSAIYDVVITNIAGSVTSSVATLFVTLVPAKVTPVIVNGFIVGATLIDGGCGYTNQPDLFFSGQGGIGATGYGEINGGSVTNVVITSAGFGYPSNTLAQVGPPFFPSVSILLTNTPAAAATPAIINGFIVGADLTASGSNYTVAPVVTFSDESGNGAAAYAQINNGSVTNIVVTSAGFGYSSNTVINIPPAAYQNAVIPSAYSLMLLQTYQLQTGNDLSSWTGVGSPFTATNSAWTPAYYWNIANADVVFFRLQMLP